MELSHRLLGIASRIEDQLSTDDGETAHDRQSRGITDKTA